MDGNDSHVLPNVRLFSVLCASIESSRYLLYRRVIDREPVTQNKSHVRSQVHTEHPQSTLVQLKGCGLWGQQLRKSPQVIRTWTSQGQFPPMRSEADHLPGWCKDLRMDKLPSYQQSLMSESVVPRLWRNPKFLRSWEHQIKKQCLFTLIVIVLPTMPSFSACISLRFKLVLRF